jgi:hypothetical protein
MSEGASLLDGDSALAHGHDIEARQRWSVFDAQTPGKKRLSF